MKITTETRPHHIRCTQQRQEKINKVRWKYLMLRWKLARNHHQPDSFFGRDPNINKNAHTKTGNIRNKPHKLHEVTADTRHSI